MPGSPPAEPCGCPAFSKPYTQTTGIPFALRADEGHRNESSLRGRILSTEGLFDSIMGARASKRIKKHPFPPGTNHLAAGGKN